MTTSFKIDMRLKDVFFDRPNLLFAIDAAERKTLSRIGAFLRKRARSQLRKRKRVSQAGESPSVHSNDNVQTLRNILFGYEASTHGVVVGPVKLNQYQSLNGAFRSGTIPELLEFGGEAGIREWYSPFSKRWIQGALRSKRRRAEVRTRVRRAKYKARPFMGPALDAEVQAGTIPAAWSGAIQAA